MSNSKINQALNILAIIITIVLVRFAVAYYRASQIDAMEKKVPDAKHLERIMKKSNQK